MKPRLRVLPCLDSKDHAERCRTSLDISRQDASHLGQAAMDAMRTGAYRCRGRDVSIAVLVETARAGTVSIRPDDQLPGATLDGDPMYEAHRERPFPDSTAWAIYSPAVPVFRTDEGTPLDEPWLLSFLTCAAPYAPTVGQPLSGDLLEARISRVLAIAQAFGHATLVLGAWGCGAFANDPHRTARDFRAALEGPFAGAFEHVVFAITDWSSERRFLGPFRDAFAEE